MQYSRLELSHQKDRPVAIAGLEQRLIGDLNVFGCFGMLDSNQPGLLRRSILWRRAKDVASLKLIDFGNSVKAPPTWSWMAYDGPIDYLELPFGQVEWEQHDIRSLWSQSTIGKRYSTDGSADAASLHVVARRFTPDAKTRVEEVDIISDIDTAWEMRCVVLGRLRMPFQEARSQLHFALLVAEAEP